MHENDRLFSNKDLISLIIPLIIEQFLAITVGMADTMMVSYAGEAAVSGVSLVDMINNVIIALLSALATGGAVLISQSLGAGKKEEANLASSQLITLAFSVSSIITLVILVNSMGIIRFFFGGIENDVADACNTYLWITAISFPLLALYNAGSAIFRSIGDSKTSMKVSLVMNIINIAGNAIFVLGFKMGVAGVAIPSVISRGIAAFIILYLCFNTRDMSLRLNTKQIFRIDKNLLRRMLYIGVPAGIENSLFQMGRVVVVSIIAGFGTVQIAANAVANNLDGLGVNIGNAFSIAMITVVGRCIGAKGYEQAEYYTKKILLWSYVSIAVTGGIILIFLNPFIDIYNISEATKELTAKLVMIYMGVGIFIWPLSFVLPNALRAGSDVRFTMSISLFSMVFFRIATSMFLAKTFGIGAVGVWWAMIMDWVFRSTCFVYRFYSGKWKTKAI